MCFCAVLAIHRSGGAEPAIAIGVSMTIDFSFFIFLWEKRLLKTLSLKTKQPVLLSHLQVSRFIRKSMNYSTFVLGLGLLYFVLCFLVE